MQVISLLSLFLGVGGTWSLAFALRTERDPVAEDIQRQKLHGEAMNELGGFKRYSAEDPAPPVEEAFPVDPVHTIRRNNGVLFYLGLIALTAAGVLQAIVVLKAS